MTNRTALRDEQGQGLVEYALILALVSLAAIVALGFLSGKINDLFSKAGNSLNTVQVASGGTGTGTGTGSGTSGPALPTVPTQVSPGVWFSPGGSVDGGPDNYQNMTGVYSDSGGPVGSPCSFTVAGASWTGVWINEDTGPGDGEWEISGDGSDAEYDWACLNVSAPVVPQPGSATLVCVPAGACDENDQLRAQASGFTGSPNDYDFQFEWASTSGGNCNSPGSVIDDAILDDGNGDLTVDISNFSGQRCYHVRARGQNSNGNGPWSAYSAWVFVSG
jgi:pilus assembly protein Flp/PilA